MAKEYSGGPTLSEELKAINGCEERGSGSVFNICVALLCVFCFVCFQGQNPNPKLSVVNTCK